MPGGSKAPPGAPADQAAPTNGGFIEVSGRTQAVPSRKAIISAVPLHPVVEVAVAAGDRVKKGQVLIRLDDDEPKADVRAKEAALEGLRIQLKESRRYLESSEKLHEKGALSEHHLHEMRAATLKTEADERNAVAALEGVKAELEHYTLEAPIDGVVSWLDVYVGTTLRPRTSAWGEILDLSEIDVRCELTPEQADQVTAGQRAEVRAKGKKEAAGVGKVVYVGIAADESSGLVPAVVRMDNAKAGLRCGVPVGVRFGVAGDDKSGR
jgi:RND family efflux transporter MFP subunit